MEQNCPFLFCTKRKMFCLSCCPFIYFYCVWLRRLLFVYKQATFFSGLSPLAAVDAHQSLDRACQNLVVATELHALYLLTPLDGLEPDWARFREEYTAWREDDPARIVGKAVSRLKRMTPFRFKLRFRVRVGLRLRLGLRLIYVEIQIKSGSDIKIEVEIDIGKRIPLASLRSRCAWAYSSLPLTKCNMGHGTACIQ